MQVIGLCRFSYPALGGFQVQHESPEARAAYLYDPARMAARFATFETMTLASLRGQSDPDFTYVIVTGDAMPQPYKDRLTELTEDMPQVVLQSHPPGPHRDVMKAAINAVREPAADPCLQFRLDDDDAVGTGFVRQLRKTAERAYPLMHRTDKLAIDFTQGHIAQPGPHGISAAPVQRQYWSPALAVMLSAQTDLSVMNFSHHRIWQRMTTVTQTGTDMMLRGYSDHNDSRQKPAARDVPLTPLDARGEAHFKATYNVDADMVRRVFSAAQ